MPLSTTLKRAASDSYKSIGLIVKATFHHLYYQFQVRNGALVRFFSFKTLLVDIFDELLNGIFAVN
jgi:hypothetical protein